MYESGNLTGKIVYVRPQASYVWDEEAKDDLNALTKVITSHLSRSRSDTASKAKTEFLSKISHEIRTPMNAILGLTDIASKAFTEHDAERTRDCLTKIGSSARFLLSIINDVLDMSKIESGTVMIENKPFDAAAAVNDIAQMIKPLIEQKNIEFITDLKLTENRVLGDEARLKQVLTNLLGNAVKFTDSGSISFTCKEEAGNDPDKHFYTFSVSDTGIGISKEDSERIFGSYVQLSSSDKVYGGTGLGLSISAKIVRLMGGNIEVESEVGHGSNFRFTIPLLINDAPDETPIEERDYTNYFTGKRVLLVEDNELNTEIAVTVLEEAGFEVVAAENGEQGADEYDTRPDGYFDVILMDIRMPVLDGLGATRLIRTNPRHPDARNIPIIAMTANAFDEDMRKSLEAGMSGYLPKPIDTIKMYKMLETILSGGHDGEFIR
jgi:CheY-like chemotaxis protein